MRSMEEGQAATLGATVIETAQMRLATCGDDGRRQVICGVFCGLRLGQFETDGR